MRYLPIDFQCLIQRTVNCLVRMHSGVQFGWCAVVVCFETTHATYANDLGDFIANQVLMDDDMSHLVCKDLAILLSIRHHQL